MEEGIARGGAGVGGMVTAGGGRASHGVFLCPISLILVFFYALLLLRPTQVPCSAPLT